MKNNLENLKKNLIKICPNPDSEYTKQEIIDMLKDMQNEMSEYVYGITKEESKLPKQFVSSLENLITQYDIKEYELQHRFVSNMDYLGHTIACYINGQKGEAKAKEGLRLLEEDPNTEVLYNIELKDDELCTEYDAIVINEYGIFVIEVKNSKTNIEITKDGWLSKDDSFPYDIPYKMGIKENLIKKYLGDDFPTHYQGVMMVPNYRVVINDNYKKIPITHGKGIASKIKEYKEVENKLSNKEIINIKNIILKGNSNTYKVKCRVNCEEIINDFVALITLIEEAKKATEEIALQDNKSSIIVEANKEKQFLNNNRTRWSRKAFGFFATIIAFLSVIISYVITRIVKVKRTIK